MLKPRPSIWTGLPRLPASPFQRAVSNTPADRTGACVDCFPARAAFPEQKAGRRLHRLFRGLLELHSRYGPLDRSAAQGGLCHEASTRPVAQPRRSSASGSIDNSIRGRSGRWDSAACCGRSVLGFRLSTWCQGLRIGAQALKHKRFQRLNMFPDGHSGRASSDPFRV